MFQTFGTSDMILFFNSSLKENIIYVISLFLKVYNVIGYIF